MSTPGLSVSGSRSPTRPHEPDQHPITVTAGPLELLVGGERVAGSGLLTTAPAYPEGDGSRTIGREARGKTEKEDTGKG